MEVRQQVIRLKQHFKPDLIHMNYTGPAVYFHLRTAEAHPAPFLLTIHSASPIHAGGPDTLLGQALQAADWVTTCSEALLADARQLAPEITSHSSIIHSGLEVPDLLPEPLPVDVPRLLCLGRIVPQKGFDLALSAFASLRHRFARARLVIAGDGPARAALEQQAAGLRLTHAVDFIGWVAPDKVPELMNTATIVIMPSRWEGLPIVALQATVMARPIVATSVGGLPEVVVHQQTGLLVEQEDSEALADAIAFLLDHPEAATTMGGAGRLRAQRLFSLERHVDSYDALYRTLIHGAAHVGASASPPPH